MWSGCSHLSCIFVLVHKLVVARQNNWNNFTSLFGTKRNDKPMPPSAVLVSREKSDSIVSSLTTRRRCSGRRCIFDSFASFVGRRHTSSPEQSTDALHAVRD
eukprot:Selendium_serpulae@DN5230_c4_g1_i1.p1